MLSRAAILASTFAFMAPSAFAADWPQADADKAVALVARHEANDGSAKMFSDAGTTIKHTVEQRDINGDGTPEIIIESRAAEDINGAQYIWGPNSYQTSLLISDGHGGWSGSIGMNLRELQFHSRPNGQWPDIELVGAAVGHENCNPIYRYFNGSYEMWKLCGDGDQPVYADVADWVEPGVVVVPRDYNDTPASIDNSGIPESEYRAPTFDHNGSAVLVDHRHGIITYAQPKKSIAGTVRKGDVLFRADAPWDQYDADRSIHGTAYVFKKGCEPAPYKVSGGFVGIWQVLVLKGLAPVRDKKSCAILGYQRTSNSVLKFESYVD